MKTLSLNQVPVVIMTSFGRGLRRDVKNVCDLAHGIA